MSEPIEVTATIRDSNTQLDIAWTVTNRGSKPLLAFVRPLRHNDTPDDEAIYVSQRENGEIELSLRSFRVPEGVNPTAHDRIAAVPLAPGQRLEGRAQVALPLAVYAPYEEPVSLTRAPRAARVCIGVLDAEAKFPVSSRTPDGTVATYHSNVVASLQQVACSPSITLPAS